MLLWNSIPWVDNSLTSLQVKSSSWHWGSSLKGSQWLCSPPVCSSAPLQRLCASPSSLSGPYGLIWKQHIRCTRCVKKLPLSSDPLESIYLLGKKNILHIWVTLSCALERLRRLALIVTALMISNVSEDTAAWLFGDVSSHYEIQFPFPFHQNSSELTLESPTSDTISSQLVYNWKTKIIIINTQ